jgi:transcription elongation factor SPT6
LDTGPPQLIQDDNDISSDSENYHPVLSIAYSDDWNLPSFGCFLNGFGEVVDYIRLNHIQKKMGDQEKEKEMTTLKQSMMKQKPSMVVIAATSRTALLILDELKACVHETCPEQCSVVEIMDPGVPSLCAKLNRYKEAYPSYPDLLRIAVSSGRYAQEPLYEMASLCESSDDEILSLRLHHLQMAVPQSLLKERLELEIVTKVNQVGVNINFCIEHPHAESILSFVSGFGPRKAVGLLKNLRQENIQLQNRSQLVTQCSIGPQVFINCAGFIKISPSTFGMSDSSYVEILDSTRIHPETYEWARKMAIDALEYDETGDESNPSAAVEDVMETPEKLRDLDLDAFADELERQEYGNKRATLYDIRDELFAPFKDHRVPFNGMSAENKFALLISEPIHTIYIGKLITCTVTGIARKRLMRDVIAQATPLQDRVTGYWQCPFCLRDDFPDITMVWPHFDDNSCPGQAIGVRTKLENNLNGFISVKNLSDNRVDNPESRVQIGMTLHSRIIAVNYEKLSVDLSCRSSDLKDDQGKFGLRKDMYYDYQSEDVDNVKKNKGNEKTKQKYMRRVIVHPCFMNITYVEACERLKELDQGDAIFRPSSQVSHCEVITSLVSFIITTLLLPVHINGGFLPIQWNLSLWAPPK